MAYPCAEYGWGKKNSDWYSKNSVTENFFVIEIPVQERRTYVDFITMTHNGHDGVSNHRRLDCLLKRLFRRKSQRTSKLRITSLCEGNSPVTGEFPAQRASNAENVSIWWRPHVIIQWGYWWSTDAWSQDIRSHNAGSFSRITRTCIGRVIRYPFPHTPIYHIYEM